GNVFRFIEQKENLTFPETIEYLAKRINYVLPENDSKADAYKREIKQQLWDIHKAAARFYYECLNADMGAEARAYLDKRGVQPNIRKKFGLGYSPDDWDKLNNYLLELGFDREMILKSGLVNAHSSGRYYDKFRNRLMFPIIDVYGHIIGFGGRQLRDNKEEAKYLNSPDTEIFNKSFNPYNLNFARHANKREFILVEGYMDVISLYQAGFKNAVAALGTAFNQNHASVLKKHTKNIIVLFDSDAAGENAVLRALPILREAGISARVLQVKGAKDPDEYIKSYGAEAFAKLLDTAMNSTMFRIEHEKKKYSLNNIDDKIALTNDIVAILAQTENPLELDLYIRDVSNQIGVSPEAIMGEVNRIRGIAANLQKNGAGSGGLSTKVKNTQVDNALEDAKSGLICLMAADKNIFESVRKVFDKKEFLDELYVKLYDIIEKLHNQSGPIQAADIVTYLNGEEDEVQSRAARILMAQLPYDSDEQRRRALSDDLKVIKTNYIDRMMDEADDDEQILRLVQQKKNVENIIKSL
ncbi:MAG: DNA primase, partial [Firmicutes bacterium]|nr:DNA primase [Bacillota bacterium]